MSKLWDEIQKSSTSSPNKLAIIGKDSSYTWDDLYHATLNISRQLTASSHKVIALYADNCPEWVIIDLSCHLAGITLLPLPAFFSEQQLQHAIRQSGVTAIIHQMDDRISTLLSLSSDDGLSLLGDKLILNNIKKQTVTLPNGTEKITFTSGSTGQPKGVCLSNEQQLHVAESLLEATQLIRPKHLSILPFSTLLENIGGIYAPLLSGGTVIALPQAVLGFNGSSGFDVDTLTKVISDYKPNSLILLPELLLALVTAIKRGWQVPESLRFIAVGGSKVSANLLQLAEQSGLPVYQGYGLSECGSVVSLNSPNDNKLGTIGKPLPHVNVMIEQGEIVVSGNSFLGYINEPDSWSESKVYTGDLGFFDDENYLHITGRKKNLLISSFGRNINPEWIESELLANGLLQQCVVFSDAKPYCIALVLPRDKTTSSDDIQLWIDSINKILPDYAHIKAWFHLSSPMTFEQGLYTSNGRPVRKSIYDYYKTDIEQFYQG